MDARSKWKLLRNAVTRGRERCQVFSLKFNPIFHHLFSATNLIHNDHFEVLDLTARQIDQSQPVSSPTIRLCVPNDVLAGDVDFEHRLNILTGFDNTGNMQLWPSELILAHSLLRPNCYPGLWISLSRLCTSSVKQNIFELGAGISGLAGLSSLYCSHISPQSVLLTDGNELCVDSLRSMVMENSTFFPAGVHVDAVKLVWSVDEENQLSPTTVNTNLEHRFQLILAADCFFNTTTHEALFHRINYLLSMSTSSAFVGLAPLRGCSLNQFVALFARDANWDVQCLHPKDYMSPELLAGLLDALDVNRIDRSQVYDKWIGHLIIVRRLNELIDICN